MALEDTSLRRLPGISSFFTGFNDGLNSPMPTTQQEQCSAGNSRNFVSHKRPHRNLHGAFEPSFATRNISHQSLASDNALNMSQGGSSHSNESSYTSPLRRMAGYRFGPGANDRPQPCISRLPHISNRNHRRCGSLTYETHIYNNRPLPTSFLASAADTVLTRTPSESSCPRFKCADKNVSRSDSMQTKKHYCRICNKSFNRPSTLATHANTHTGATPYQCPWPHCGRKFNVKSNMRRHVRNHSSNRVSQSSFGGAGEFRVNKEGALQFTRLSPPSSPSSSEFSA